ncbi:GNAT family N-acetyltransferase [Phreatobacter aquaticus]|uniref:GNAT family N-acetyltransferase n=1 Tax=Phreatobacter aquaticus TaxID=2570229 RepID=A0A4D7QNE2_9HYPH|nr:GNAT family N-acetyltransferase [Phreatobacter aquaticus]QCK88021.1 GNAT family N-acetyltransferase [Phreatobacter aquaticus]
MTANVRLLTPADRAEWEPLWRGYQAFYETSIPAATTDVTWQRFHDPAEPMVAFGAFDKGRMVGIVHAIRHRSCWTVDDYCYLQDLFVDPATRGTGAGRALIEAVYGWAKGNGCGRVHWLTQESNAQARLLYDRIADRPGFIQYRNIF